MNDAYIKELEIHLEQLEFDKKSEAIRLNHLMIEIELDKKSAEMSGKRLKVIEDRINETEQALKKAK